jgi:SAM-dependent methyltransferase
MDLYDNWFGSPFYKILYQNRDEFEAQEFVVQLIKYLQPPVGSRMLDIACGEGRFAKLLTAQGFDVKGIDISNAAIETAKASETDNLEFFVHDMRFPFYINYFDYAFNFFTSFGYFANARDHALAARSFAAGLKKDGILVIDYLNYEHVMENLVPQEVMQRGSYTFTITRTIRQNHIIKEISFIDGNKKEHKYVESVAAFSLADFNKMFRAAGMSLVGAFGDYQLHPYHPVDSPRLIMIFKKKNA